MRRTQRRCASQQNPAPDAREESDSAAAQCPWQTGRCTAKPRGGSVSPLEKHADFLLGLIARRPDLTLDEAVLAMHRHKIPGSRSAMWRFFKHHNVTFKKKPARGGAGARGRGASAPALDARTGHV